MLNKHERQGKVDEAKGHVKQAIGKAVGSPGLKVEGAVDIATGKAKSAFGKAVRKVDEAKDKVDKAAKDAQRPEDCDPDDDVH